MQTFEVYHKQCASLFLTDTLYSITHILSICTVKNIKNAVWWPNYCSVLGNRGRWIWWRCQNFERKLKNSSSWERTVQLKVINSRRLPKYPFQAKRVKSSITKKIDTFVHYGLRRATVKLQCMAIATFSGCVF